MGRNTGPTGKKLRWYVGRAWKNLHHKHGLNTLRKRLGLKPLHEKAK